MARSILFFLTLFFLHHPLQAQDTAYGAYGLSPLGSTRVLAMGGAFVGLADDAAATVTNPAGLALSRWRLDISGGTNRTINREVDINADEVKDGFPYTSTFTSAALRIGFLGLGGNMGLPYLLQDSDPDDSIHETLKIETYDIALALSLTDFLAIGATARLEKATLDYQNPPFSQSANDTDEMTYPLIGILLHADRKLSLGITWSPQRRYDINENLAASIGGNAFFYDVVIPQKTTIGAAIKVSNRLTWVGDIDFYEGVKNTIVPGVTANSLTGQILSKKQSVMHGGFEFSVLDSKDVEFIWRGGGYQEPARLQENSSRFHFTMGVEARLGIIVFAAAYDQAPDFSNVAQSVSISFGAL